MLMMTYHTLPHHVARLPFTFMFVMGEKGVWCHLNLQMEKGKNSLAIN